MWADVAGHLQNKCSLLGNLSLLRSVILQLKTLSPIWLRLEKMTNMDLFNIRLPRNIHIRETFLIKESTLQFFQYIFVFFYRPLNFKIQTVTKINNYLAKFYKVTLDYCRLYFKLSIESCLQFIRQKLTEEMYLQ